MHTGCGRVQVAVKLFQLSSTRQRCSFSGHLSNLHRQYATNHGSNLTRSFQNPSSQARYDSLNSVSSDLFPRVERSDLQVTCLEFARRYSDLASGETLSEKEIVLHGRVSSVRSAGNKLYFLDIKQDGQRIQGVCNLGQLNQVSSTKKGFLESFKRLQVGDILQLKGYPHKTSSGQLSLLLKTLPTVSAPCLPQLPIGLQDKETRARNRHVDYIVNPSMIEPLRIKNAIIQHIRNFLLEDGHIEVQTPILSAEAGGASARPFETIATEFPTRDLTLRIAPELWLKRLVIGGFDRVFEIGPSFRNEGIDNTHNPEFTTCEFYRSYTGIDELMDMTEKLLAGLQERLATLKLGDQETSSPLSRSFGSPFARIDFLTGLESEMNRKLPKLDSPVARNELQSMLRDFSLDVREELEVPQMLDILAGRVLEPKCQEPTFITNHPECMSPLSKTHLHPETGQLVTARAELFVGGTEIINMYEEENSPAEQKRKFVQQRMLLGDHTEDNINYSYLEALEWGLPPTGGWGCGIERLCMLMSGADRIGDVLSFGNLRHVASTGIGTTENQG